MAETQQVHSTKTESGQKSRGAVVQRSSFWPEAWGARPGSVPQQAYANPVWTMRFWERSGQSGHPIRVSATIWQTGTRFPFLEAEYPSSLVLWWLFQKWAASMSVEFFAQFPEDSSAFYVKWRWWGRHTLIPKNNQIHNVTQRLISQVQNFFLKASTASQILIKLQSASWRLATACLTRWFWLRLLPC